MRAAFLPLLGAFLCLFFVIACDFVIGYVELGGERDDERRRLYTVTFVILDEFIICQNCDPIRGEEGDVITLPTPRHINAADGWVFDGWFRETADGEDEDNAYRYGGGGDKHTITGDAEMLPQFSRIVLNP